MSFLVKQPTLPQGAAAADPKLSSGYKAAEVVPLGWGREIFPSKWISNKYDERKVPGEKNQPERQLCSILAAYEIGACDFIGFVFNNGKRIEALDYTFSDDGSPESKEFTLTSQTPARMIVHRGTPDTAAATVANVRTKTGQPHPPYRGYVWIEWIDLDVSNGLPSFAVELGTPVPAVGGFAGGMFSKYGVNPFAAVHALCLAATGGGFDAALLDATHWGDQCTALETDGVAGRTGHLVYCNPVFTASTTLADAISQILAYVDGYVYATGGQLRVGWFPSAAVDAGTLPEITEADLEAKPGGSGFPDWNEGATSVVVIFKSFDRDYGEDAARYRWQASGCRA